MEEEIQSAYQEELQRLKKTAAEIDRQLQALRAIPRYYGDDLTEQALDNIRIGQMRNLGIAEPEPYFGRLDFQEEGQAQPLPLYIGKVGVENPQTGELLVIDWRAPVASLFYAFTGGEEQIAYESPEGTIAGLVYLKRNLVVRQQILQRVVDAYVKGGDNLGVTDEFLLYKLSENKDNRLRDIVSTIQEEQDRIIRSAKNKALVIQGVAGSGKTTVALHRLAYLLYQYRENVRAERMIIFAPNSMFLDYISGVLPELGVGGIQQTTFSDWVLDLLQEKIKLADPTERMSDWFAPLAVLPSDDDQIPGRYKGSIRFMQVVGECLDHYEAEFVPRVDFVAWEGVTLTASTISEWFHVEYQHYPLAKRRERVIARIKRWLEMQYDQIRDANRRKEQKKKTNAKLRSYLKNWPDHTPFAFYKELFQAGQQPDYLPDELLARIPAAIAEASRRRLKKKEIEPEDLAPLIYIRQRLQGIEGNDFFDHVVIDEAQDFSPFQVAVLKAQTRGHSFTILGDLSQGIHSYQGIRDWAEFLDLFEPEEQAYFRLDRSYRSTMEIIHFANAIIEQAGEDLTLAKPVFRSGEPVRLIQQSSTGRFAQIARLIEHLQHNQMDTIAVIARTDAECIVWHEALSKAGLAATRIHSGQREYRGGLSVLPIYMSKGLEFDAVLLVDVDADHYADTALDAKLLYVGCTRALHQLLLFYTEQKAPILAGVDADLYSRELPASTNERTSQ